MATTGRSSDAARLVFAVHGPDAPVSAVAAEAGVGIGSLYRRYPSKEALLQHLCLESMRQLAAAAERALAELDPWEALTGFMRECIGFRAGPSARPSPGRSRRPRRCVAPRSAATT